MYVAGVRPRRAHVPVERRAHTGAARIARRLPAGPRVARAAQRARRPLRALRRPPRARLAAAHVHFAAPVRPERASRRTDGVLFAKFLFKSIKHWMDSLHFSRVQWTRRDAIAARMFPRASAVPTRMSGSLLDARQTRSQHRRH